MSKRNERYVKSEGEEEERVLQDMMSQKRLIFCRFLSLISIKKLPMFTTNILIISLSLQKDKKKQQQSNSAFLENVAIDVLKVKYNLTHKKVAFLGYLIM